VTGSAVRNWLRLWRAGAHRAGNAGRQDLVDLAGELETSTVGAHGDSRVGLAPPIWTSRTTCRRRRARWRCAAPRPHPVASSRAERHLQFAPGTRLMPSVL